MRLALTNLAFLAVFLNLFLPVQRAVSPMLGDPHVPDKVNEVNRNHFCRLLPIMLLGVVEADDLLEGPAFVGLELSLGNTATSCCFM